MLEVLADILAGRRKCGGLEERLERLPRYRPQFKRLLADTIAECIIELLGEDLVEEIYLVDLSGGEITTDFSGRDVDIIIIGSDKLVGHEGDVKRVLETYFNMIFEKALGFYIAETGKREIVEIHVSTSLDMGYGRLVRSRFYPAIPLWKKRRKSNVSIGLGI